MDWKKYWYSKEGKVEYKDMDNEHLKNAIAFCFRNKWANNDGFRRLLDEFRRRVNQKAVAPAPSSVTVNSLEEVEKDLYEVTF